MSFALLVDFGSTYTKLRAVSLDDARVVASAQGPSTVGTDVTVGLQCGLERLHAQFGEVPRYRWRLGASSAAGGLRMVTVGLVRELTAEAARQAALGAGARLVASHAGRLTRADVRAIVELAPDVLLLCGGTDGGNRDTIVHNARALAASPLACPIVVAGNREAADEVMDVLQTNPASAVLADNVMPELNVLSIESARAAIRGVFMRRIVHAKGIDRAGAWLDDVLMPTPAAVLEGALLLSRGPSGGEGLGPLLVIDPGGATTDVHSIGDGEPRDGAVRLGLPEPYAKRSVEGDLGMRHNAHSIVEAVGEAVFCREAGIGEAQVRELLARIAADVERLPQGADEQAVDDALGRCAIRLAVRRHAGSVETVYTAHGPVQVQRGKDLGAFATVIGTGGVLVAARRPESLLAAALADPARPHELCPRAPNFFVDRDYVLYGCGLLAGVAPQVAYALASASLHRVGADERERRAHA